MEDSAPKCLSCTQKLLTGGKALARTVFSWQVIKPILYGQGLSLLICGTAITSTYLVEDYNANVPCTQSLCNYFLLAAVYGTMLVLNKNQSGDRILLELLKSYWWKYLLITVADVTANYLIVRAYQYTSLTSVQVLDCFVILIVMLLSWFVLKTCYKVVHYVGVAIALLGVAFMIIADVMLEKGGSGPNPLLGDIMVLGGATCYGVSNVGMEYVVKHRRTGNLEILGMFGIFGTVISGVLVACFERQALAAIKWTGMTYALFLGFALCMFLLYSFMPAAMKLSSATTVNLSILTADLYALFAGVFLFGYKFTPLYIVSFVVITCSLVIYNSMPPGTAAQPENGADEENGAENSIPVGGTSETSLLDVKRVGCQGTWFTTEVCAFDSI